MKKIFVTLSFMLMMSPTLAGQIIYFEPPVVEPAAEVLELECSQLDQAINKLHPYRYTYKPDFYQDQFNQVAAGLISFGGVFTWVGVGGLGYSSYVDEKEQRRQLTIEQQISALQSAKAQKHCYEF